MRADAAVLFAEASAGALSEEVLESGALVVGATDSGCRLWKFLLRALDGQLRPPVVYCAGCHCGSLPCSFSSQGEASLWSQFPEPCVRSRSPGVKMRCDAVMNAGSDKDHYSWQLA